MSPHTFNNAKLSALQLCSSLISHRSSYGRYDQTGRHDAYPPLPWMILVNSSPVIGNIGIHLPYIGQKRLTRRQPDTNSTSLISASWWRLRVKFTRSSIFSSKRRLRIHAMLVAALVWTLGFFSKPRFAFWLQRFYQIGAMQLLRDGVMGLSTLYSAALKSITDSKPFGSVATEIEVC